MKTPPAASVAPALREVLRGAVDYAGLFPPASLDLPTAVRNFAEYRDGPDAWALGRFVIPIAQLDELVDAGEGNARAQQDRGAWPLSVLTGAAPSTDRDRIVSFNDTSAGRYVVDAIEVRADVPDSVERLATLAGLAQLFVEVPARGRAADLLAGVRAIGAAAKLRTGGVTPETFPASTDVARFIAECAALDLPFKATAGLHHPLRAEYPLTYAADAPRGTMFGYVNVVLAAALARRGVPLELLVHALEEEHAESFELTEDSLRWRGESFAVQELRETRTGFMRGFGSCSFREPLDEIGGVFGGSLHDG